MKHIIKLALPFIVAFGVFAYAATLSPVRAASPGVSFNPNSGSYTTGQDFSVSVYGTGGGGWGILNTNVAVTYPANLTVKGVNKDGSALGSATLQHNAANRTVSFTLSEWGGYPALDNAKLFTITFQGTGAGTAALDFSSTIVRAATVAKSPSTYAIVNPTCPAGQVGTPPNCSTPAPATCPAGQVGTPPNCTTPAPAATKPATTSTPKPSSAVPNTSTPTPASPAPTPTAEPTAVTIADNEVTASYSSASVTWSTDSASSGSLRYGTSATSLDASAEVTSDPSQQKFSASLSNLRLGVKYFYEISVNTPSGAAATQTGEFTTKAYPVTVRVTQDGAPVKKLSLKLKGFDDTYTTNDKGEAALSLLAGEYTLELKGTGITNSQPFTVKPLSVKGDTPPATQVVDIKLTAALAAQTDSSPNLLLIIIGGGLLLLISALGVAALLWKRHKDQERAELGYQSVIIDDVTSDTPAAPTDITAYQPPNPVVAPIDTYNYAPTEYVAPSTDTYAALPPEEIPMASSEPIAEEPLDMWSASQPVPASTDSTSEQQLYPMTPQELPPQPEALAYQYPQEPVVETLAAPEPSPQIDTLPPTPGLVPQPEESSLDPTGTGDYEYNDDNNLIIHHST